MAYINIRQLNKYNFGSGNKSKISVQNYTHVIRVLRHLFFFQLENTLGGVEALQTRVKSTVTPCIVQLAVAAGDDTLWKHLNYQVLLKTRHNSPHVSFILEKPIMVSNISLQNKFRN